MMEQIDNYVFISIAILGLLIIFFFAKTFYEKKLLKEKLSKHHNSIKK
jgi:accessory gene regulator protein AgrB